MCPAKAFNGTAPSTGPLRQPHWPVMYAAGTIHTLRNTKSMSDLMKRPPEGIIMYLECMCPAEAFNGTAPSTGPLRQPHWPVMYAAGTIHTLRNTKSMSDLMKRPLEGIIMYLECMCPAEAFNGTATVNGAAPSTPWARYVRRRYHIYTYNHHPHVGLDETAPRGRDHVLDCMYPAKAFDGTALSMGRPVIPVGPLCTPQVPYIHLESLFPSQT
jgi:hypothetical protein